MAEGVLDLGDCCWNAFGWMLRRWHSLLFDTLAVHRWWRFEVDWSGMLVVDGWTDGLRETKSSLGGGGFSTYLAVLPQSSKRKGEWLRN
jgi:hypothetical protein